MRGLRAITILGMAAALMGCVPAYVDGPVYGGGYAYVAPSRGYVVPRYYAPPPRFYAPPPRFHGPPPRFHGPPRYYGGGHRGWHGDPYRGRHWRGG